MNNNKPQQQTQQHQQPHSPSSVEHSDNYSHSSSVSVSSTDPDFKPPDRSTSAPPVLTLQPESLFAFRAAEHLNLFADVRCEDNYYEFYRKYQNQGNPLPPPLENQPILVDNRHYYSSEEDQTQHHLISHHPSNPLLHNTPPPPPRGYQPDNQQMQQHRQQQQQQQQQYSVNMEARNGPPPPRSTSNPHYYIKNNGFDRYDDNRIAEDISGGNNQQGQNDNGIWAPLPRRVSNQGDEYGAPPPLLDDSSHPSSSSSSSHPSSHPSSHHPSMHMQQQYQQHHQQQSQHHTQPPHHPYATHIFSNHMPSHYSHGGGHHTQQSQQYHPQQQQQQQHHHQQQQQYMQQQQQQQHMQQQHSFHPHHNMHSRASEQAYYQQQMQQMHAQQQQQQLQDYDSVAFSTANNLLKEENIQAIWNDRGYDRQQQMPQYKQPYGHPMASPTPTTLPPSHPSSSLLGVGNTSGMMGNGYRNSDSLHDNSQISRRRSNSGGRNMNHPPSPPPQQQQQQSNNITNNNNQPICRYYAQGYCSRGDRCNFLHEVDSHQDNNNKSGIHDTLGIGYVSKSNNKPKKSIPSAPPVQTTLPPKSPSPSIISPMMNNNSNNNTPSRNAINQLSLNLGHLSLGPLPTTSSSSSSSPPLSAGSVSLSTSTSNGSQAQPSSVIGGGASSSVPRSTTPQSGLDLFANGPASPSSKLDGEDLNGDDMGAARQYTSIDQVMGHIYSLCKDQHGCRFLQKKLEDRDPSIVEIIFTEVYEHMTELMIDPFGNYLCQKLLEHCNDEQRLAIIEKVSPDLVKISKNMHGTRAVQKMIEYLTTPEQIAIAKRALANHVVTLIQDLNGNHVIQRCLNRLSPQDNQFIYDSVSQERHCVEVATHRHGCCVLQRCVDHASDSQKLQLINEIIANALVLVQDPYGNYVVQYVLDLPFPGLASKLARRFLGHIPILSTQKFSSNVVEKCLNVADQSTRANIIQEVIEHDNLLYLLQDPYANYVIQTSLNVSEPVQHARLVEAIRPHLTALRNTPYGKRIQNKILKESSRDYYA